jgi:hypothetical protein
VSAKDLAFSLLFFFVVAIVALILIGTSLWVAKRFRIALGERYFSALVVVSFIAAAWLLLALDCWLFVSLPFAEPMCRLAGH